MVNVYHALGAEVACTQSESALPRKTNMKVEKEDKNDVEKREDEKRSRNFDGDDVCVRVRCMDGLWIEMREGGGG